MKLPLLGKQRETGAVAATTATKMATATANKTTMEPSIGTSGNANATGSVSFLSLALSTYSRLSVRSSSRSSSRSRSTAISSSAATSTRLFSGSEAADGAGDEENGYRYRRWVRRGIHRLFREMIDGERAVETEKGAATKIGISPIEPFLHLFPDDLHPCYRSPPRLVQALTVLFTASAAAVSTTWKRKLSAAASVPYPHPYPYPNVYQCLFWARTLTTFLLRSVAYFVIAQVALQETVFRKRLSPSRVTTDALVQKYVLPTTLSRYEVITIDPSSSPAIAGDGESDVGDSSISLGVHYLRYDNGDHGKDGDGNNNNNNNNNNDPYTNTNSNSNPSASPQQQRRKIRTFDSVYFQHGFGASSLSWLPVIPSLTHKLGARVALGHDAVGFGFTDRPQDLEWYTAKQSSRIAHQILRNESPAATAVSVSGDGDGDAQNQNKNQTNPLPVCLVGHSMGSLSILRLATALPRETPKLIILSSPALGLLGRKKPPPASPENHQGRARGPLPFDKLASLWKPIGTALRRSILRPSARYVLRRAIGTPNAWRKGLEAAWGDPSVVTEDSDVLRYSWPSIGRGWEDGILNFAGAQALPREDELDDDVVLFRRVLELPKTRVLVVLGAKDRVVPTASVRAFLEKVRRLSPEQQPQPDSVSAPIVVEMEGLGHNAFEEDREAFSETVEQLVAEHWDTADLV